MEGVLRFAARTSLAAMFVRSGVDLVRNPSGRAARAATMLPWLPRPELVTRALGVVLAVGGVAVVADLAPELTAAVLAAALVPITYVGHPFWLEAEPGPRGMQKTHFFKNLSMFGGLVYLAVDDAAHRREP